MQKTQPEWLCLITKRFYKNEMALLNMYIYHHFILIKPLKVFVFRLLTGIYSS